MRPSNDDIPDRLGPAKSRTNGRVEICEICEICENCENCEVCEQNNKTMEGWKGERRRKSLACGFL